MSENTEEYNFNSIHNAILDYVDKAGKNLSNKTSLTGLPTGFIDLDKLTGGLQPSNFIILAARPSMGKTALALNIVQNVALRAHKKIGGEPRSVAFFSLEMNKEQVIDRMLCSEAAINSQCLRIGKLNDNNWDTLWTTCDAMGKAKIYIDDTPSLTVMEIRNRTQKLKEEHGLDLIVIDYLQLIQDKDRNNNTVDRYQKVSEISHSLKILARELNIPIIAISQLNRNVENRNIKRPMLIDLHESSSLEQDADIVAFLYREDYYDPNSDNKHTELIIAKHRNGPVDTINLFFIKEYTKFCNLI